MTLARGTALVLLACFVLASACSASSPAHRIAVVESDFRIQPIVTQTPAGNTRFAVRNTGPSAHEFLVFRTNFPETALPTAADGRVVETAPGLTKVIDSGSALARGKSRSFTARLRPGAYVLVCNIGAHYGLGMHATLLVS